MADQTHSDACHRWHPDCADARLDAAALALTRCAVAAAETLRALGVAPESGDPAELAVQVLEVVEARVARAAPATATAPVVVCDNCGRTATEDQADEEGWTGHFCNEECAFAYEEVTDGLA